MANNITRETLREKEVQELTLEEMIFIHLADSDSPIIVKDLYLKSTLSFLKRNIQHSLNNDHGKDIIPYIGLCTILDQLGTCYNIKNAQEPRFNSNGIKRCLVYFGEFNENDKLIDVLFALRNGLLHKASLTSHDQYKNKYYHFRWDNDITEIFKEAEKEWNGNYDLLDQPGEQYLTLINVDLLKKLVYRCMDKAAKLNQNSLIELRLAGGKRQLYYDYIRTSEIL